MTDDGIIVSVNPSLFDHHEHEDDPFHEYRIVSGDVLDVLYQVKSWEIRDVFTIDVEHTISVRFPLLPQLNETQKVRPDGTITVPYIGKISVAKRTVNEVTEELKTRYSSILRDPEVYITVPDFAERIRELKSDLRTAPRGLSRLVTVGPDGYVTLPLIGGIHVTGKTIPELNNTLNILYEEYMPGLTVDLFLEQHVPLRVYVMGEVGTPGEYEITKPTSLLKILSRAGGPSPWAKSSNVVIMRKHEDRIITTIIDVKDILTLNNKLPACGNPACRTKKVVYLRPDDLVYVPKRRITRMAEVMRDIKDIAMFQGWGANVGFGYYYDLTRRRDTATIIAP